MEEELAWRLEEIAFFKNQINNFDNDIDKGRYRKSLILILYSHLEGYIKIALHIYIQYINELDLERKDVNSGLKAASMSNVFKAYDDLDRKCKIFKKALPEDSKLHRFYRRVDFIDKFNEFETEPLKICDDIIDTESNLWYIVLQKNLYKIGLPIEMFADYKSDIDALVNRRNGIAHGTFSSIITNEEYIRFETAFNSITNSIIRLIYDYANNSRFKVSG